MKEMILLYFEEELSGNGRASGATALRDVGDQLLALSAKLTGACVHLISSKLSYF